MSEITKPNPEMPIEWQEEMFYFGNASDPSYSIYRTSGGRIQYRVELPLEYPVDETTEVADVAQVEEFISEYSDCRVIVREGYIAPGQDDGAAVPRSAYLIGWQELATPEDQEYYREDQKYGARIRS